MDFFGRKHAGAAGSANTIGNLIGICIGLQVFTALSSDYVCKEYFKLSGKVMNHAIMFRVIACINLLSLGVLLCINEKPAQINKIVVSLSPVRVVKSLFNTTLLWKSFFWNFFGPTLVLSMKVMVGQYYIKKGIRREDYILCLAFVMIPSSIISNLIWIKIIRRGNLMFMLWLAVFNGVLVESLHAVNYSFFDKG